MGLGKAAARIVAVPVDVAGAGVNAAGEATTAVVFGTKGAVNGLLDGASGAGVRVVRGAQTAATGVTKAARKLLLKTGNSVNSAFSMRGGRRSRRNRNNMTMRSNKNRSNKNRSNKNRSNKNRSNKNRSNKNRNRN
jgi:hypothetical protein